MSTHVKYRRAWPFAIGSWRQPRAAWRSALVHLEVLASIGLTIALAALFAGATLQYAAARREYDTRRTLQFAAAAELDRIRAGLHAVPMGQSDRSPASQPGEVVISATATAGEGPWRGLTRVCVVASKRVNGRRTIEVELRAYVAGGPQP